ncbi:hypothetical protein SanJ4206_0312c [Streptococcus anginosus]|uniref:hypothetical protein n=1 Tax=Streptococcus anginosus TaxID=1328 RepID=UPI000814F2BD|nr:hypothetical protein [Streptococcus anginosus]ANW84563.1 hypothetical protein SanJ4206_0312c [Streptococcus anginosus]
MDKAKEQLRVLISFIKKHTISVVIGATTILAILVFLIVQFNSPVSVINKVKPSFVGYSDDGEVKMNDTALKNEISRIVYQKSGFDKQTIDSIMQGTNVKAIVETSLENAEKFVKAQKILLSITTGFDKTENLKNGDTVTYTISSSLKDSPIKSEKKTFKVSGLKEYADATLEKTMKYYPITFEGFEGSSRVNYNPNVLAIQEGSDTLNKLKNGDKITVTYSHVARSHVKKYGLAIRNMNEKITLKVKGLKNISDLKNLAEIEKRATELIRKRNKDYDSSVERITNQIEKLSSYVKSDTDNLISIKVVFKVVTTTNSKMADRIKTDVEYRFVSFDNLTLSNNTINISDLEHLGELDWWMHYNNLSSIEKELTGYSKIE